MENSKGMKVSGRMVLVALVAFFSVVAGVNAIMATLAIRTFGGLEAGNAYRAGLEFSRELQAAKDQQAKNIQVDVTTAKLPDGTTSFRMTTKNLAPAEMTGVQAKVELRHPADSRRDHVIVLTRSPDGSFSGTTQVERGQWNARLSLEKGDVRVFRSINRITIE